MKMALVEYELFSEDGNRVVVSGDTDEPEDIEVELYSPDLLPGLSRVVDRMAVGSTAEVMLEPAEAFGGYLPELVFATPASKLPPEILPEIGVKARLEIPGESDVEVTVMRTTEDTVVIDGNHPLHSQRLKCLVHLYERWEEEDEED